MASHDAQLLLTLAADLAEDDTDDDDADDSQSSVPDEDTWHPRQRLDLVSYNRSK